ncbi:ciliary microtubule inner protein 2A isoform X1 [Anser cygnoides]|uniref:ciliary microtubule inner protein 2A isoform X1 n=1 Tax=Anser cygnoides TaxID=8845 RepID=UPI0034D23423
MHPVAALPSPCVCCAVTWACTAQCSPSARVGRAQQCEHGHVPGLLTGNICCCPKGAEPAGNLTNSMKFPCSSKISRSFLSGKRKTRPEKPEEPRGVAGSTTVPGSITEVSRVTAASPPCRRSCHCAMTAPRESSLFPPHPHHVPGYEGFVPQYNYQFGETYGKTTYRLLTDPHVRKSPRSVLAPLCKQRFIEDFSGTQGGLQPYLPGHPGYFRHERAGAMTNFPEPVFGPKPPPPGPAEEQLLLTHVDPMPSHGPSERALSVQLEYGYPPRVACCPAVPWRPSEGQEWRLPELTTSRGLGSTPAGLRQPVKIEGVTLPGVTEAADVERNGRLPKLDVPNVIQQKVISGYTGYIPRFTWFTGVNYLQGVKEAMAEFDRHQKYVPVKEVDGVSPLQEPEKFRLAEVFCSAGGTEGMNFLQRHPIHSFGKRFPQTYWPNNRIYTGAGLIPSYTGFVPHLRQTYALTFGNSTRKAYRKEQRRRACAL